MAICGSGSSSSSLVACFKHLSFDALAPQDEAPRPRRCLFVSGRRRDIA